MGIKTLERRRMMEEATFKIKWDKSLGPKWMNVDNLKLCLFSVNCIGGKAKELVEVDEVKKE